MTCSSTTRARRSAFTLVELLVAITVIGVLVGMLAAAIFPAMKKANEFAVKTELMQIEQAIEKFKLEFGVYPPSFVKMNFQDADGDGTNWSGLDAGGVSMTGGNDVDDPLIVLGQYLNAIAPNHQENLIVTGTSPAKTRLQVWWENVGSEIGYDHGDDLMFWLSGLCKNAQFPITAGADSTIDEATFISQLPNAFDAGSPIERWNFFDFKDGQMEIEPIAGTGGVAHYNQPKGKDAPFLYIDSGSYGLDLTESSNPAFPLDGEVGFDGYQIAVRDSSGNVTARFYENPTTFQLVTFGMDGKSGNIDSDTRGEWIDAGPDGEDNLTNFSDGRLDRLILGTIKSTSKF